MSEIAVMPSLHYPNLKDAAVFDATHPRPQFLLDSEKLKMIVAGLEPGQQLPPHPEALAIYYFMAGEGVMTVDGEAYPVTAGASVITPSGSTRGIVAHTRLTFLAVKSAG